MSQEEREGNTLIQSSIFPDPTKLVIRGLMSLGNRREEEKRFSKTKANQDTEEANDQDTQEVNGANPTRGKHLNT